MVTADQDCRTEMVNHSVTKHSNCSLLNATSHDPVPVNPFSPGSHNPHEELPVSDGSVAGTDPPPGVGHVYAEQSGVSFHNTFYNDSCVGIW